MKEDKLLKALSDINDEFILEAGGCQEDKTKKRKRKPVTILALAAVLLLTLTIGVFAEETPIGKNLMRILKETPWNKSSVRYTAVAEYAEPVEEVNSGALKITETYYDGDALLVGVALTLDGTKEVDQLETLFNVKFYSDDNEISSEGYLDLGVPMVPIDDNSYFGNIMIYPKERGTDLGLPENFRVEISKKHIYGLYSDGEKISINQEFSPVNCEISINKEYYDKYELEETIGGCTLHSVTVTPLWTDIDVTLESDEATGEAIVVIRGSEGKELESLQLYGQDNSYRYISRKYETPDKAEKELTITVFADADCYYSGVVLAEFIVPIYGGYSE